MAALEFGSSFLSGFCTDSSRCLGVVTVSSTGRLENLDFSHMSLKIMYYKNIGYNVMVFLLSKYTNSIKVSNQIIPQLQI